MGNKVVLDDVLRSKLNGLNAELEVCDESGRTAGHYLPHEIYPEARLRLPQGPGVRRGAGRGQPRAGLAPPFGDLEDLGTVKSYTVLWKPAAEGQPADLWTAAPDRDAVSSAADGIDVTLRRDPLGER